jgi:phage baseplate assembly protein W
MAIVNYKDLVIRYDGHPKYNSYKVIEDNIIEVIIQKLEMILFTKTGDVFGQPNLGCDIEFYLWQTRVPATKIKSIINDQIGEYVPELNNLEYSMDINLYMGTIPERDIMYINFIINDYNVDFIFE